MFGSDQEDYERYREYQESQDDPMSELVTIGLIVVGVVVAVVFGGGHLFGWLDSVTGWQLLPWWQGLTGSILGNKG